MFTITTTQNNGKVVAKGNGKQRTVPVDHSKRMGEAQHAVAVGTLLNVLLTDKQRSKMLHPSAKQRVRVKSLSDAGGKYRFSIDV